MLKLTLMAVLVSIVFTDQLSNTLREKLIASKPQFSKTEREKLISGDISAWPYHFKVDFPTSLIETYINRSEEINFTFLGYPFSIPFYPWGKLNHLRFADKYEYYETSKNFVPGGVSSVGVKGYIAQKSGGSVIAHTVYGASAGSTVQMHNEERYESCKTVLGIKKCEWKTRNVPRGYTSTEADEIYNALVASAHDALVKKLSLSTSLFGSRRKNKDNGKRRNKMIVVFRGVKFEDVMQVLGALGVRNDNAFDLELFVQENKLDRKSVV